MKRAVRELRDLVPLRPLTQAEALRIAENQANRLLALAELTGPPFHEEVITELPRTQVVRMPDIPVSGSAHWSKGRWVIALNQSESLARQRFSLAHEFKHVLDNPFIGFLYPKQQGWTPADRAERVCDYFAACLLMPKVWVRRAWTEGVQDLRGLARRFNVSQSAMNVRLLQLGLAEPVLRCRNYERRTEELAA